MSTRKRRKHFEQRDRLALNAQIEGRTDEHLPSSPRPASSSTILERQILAGYLEGPENAIIEDRAVIIQTMVSLCGRKELYSTQLRAFSSQVKEESDEDNERKTRLSVKHEQSTLLNDIRTPWKCQYLQCLFCLGNKSIIFKHRTRVYSRDQTL